jgi:hypothetical protein
MHGILGALRPLTFAFWGFVLVAIAYGAWADATPDSSLLARFAFPGLVVSWVSGLVLIVRLWLRRRDGSSFDD